NLLLPQAHATIAANTDMSAVLADQASVTAVTDYLFGRIDAAVQAMGAQLLLAMDGDRYAIYHDTASLALTLNRLAADTAARQHIPFLDLQPIFLADWQSNHRRFDFDADSHWNEHGHEVASRAIADRL